MDTIFELRDLSYSYMEKFPALNHIDLKIRTGEQIAILGANGSGKSTLLSVLDCLIYPTSGEFYAFGNRVTEDAFNTLRDNEFNRFFRKKVGLVFQNPDVQMFSSTVYDEIAFGPLQLELPKEEIKQRVNDVIEMIGIEKLRNRTPSTLSSGEKKKVCIASVLAINPDVLLLDEPTAGLDPRTQLWLIEFLQELKELGKTIVTATHDLDAVEHISQRAIVFGEDHMIKLDSNSASVVNDHELLLSTNLIHKHMHRHGTIIHQHMHSHDDKHEHDHSNLQLPS